MKWNNVGVDFSGSSRSMGNALSGYSQAGNIFSNITNQLATERQREFDNNLNQAKEDRALEEFNRKIAGEEDSMNVINAMTSAASQAIDNSGNINLDIFDKLTSNVSPTTASGALAMQAFRDNLFKNAVDQQRYNSNLAFNYRQLAQQASQFDRSLAQQKELANLNILGAIEKEKIKQSKNNNKNSSEVYGQQIAKDIGVHPEHQTKVINAYNKTYNSIFGNNNSITKAALSGLRSNDLANIVKRQPIENGAWIYGEENTIDTDALDSISTGVPSRLSGELVLTAIKNNKGDIANVEQAKLLLENIKSGYITGVTKAEIDNIKSYINGGKNNISISPKVQSTTGVTKSITDLTPEQANNLLNITSPLTSNLLDYFK